LNLANAHIPTKTTTPLGVVVFVCLFLTWLPADDDPVKIKEM